VAFLTPTSFLGGQYFSRLRGLLLDQAPPLVVDVVEARKGVFESVQQETCLTVFGPNPSRTAVLHMLRVNDRSIASRRAGVLSLEASSGGPWMLPRTSDQASLVARASEMRTRLHHFGYKASTGPLVWNRHKSQLRQRGGNAHPLIWAEAVRPNEFNFDYRSRASAPFFAVQNGQGHLICREPCVLLQRTTAKEQQRRLVACSVPREFLDRWDGIVVENHVNVLRAFDGGSVSPEALAAVLNTEVVDQLFRCLSGSVAVSATELHALPLPTPAVFAEVEKVLRKKGAEPETRHGAIEKIVARAYRG
jgi:adenine-specific DNA-methyltransferase